MSIERRRRRDGRTVYVVRWYESGRDSTRRKRTFDRRRDAELFEASIRRARQLGQLASEVIGSNTTLEEFLVEWWDTYAATHLRPNTLATYTTLLDKWIVPYLGGKRLREINRETIDTYAARLRVDGAGAPRSTGRSVSSKASSIARSNGDDSAGTPSSAYAGSRTRAPRRSMPECPRRSRRSAASSTPRTPRSSACSPTKACARPRPTRSSGVTSWTTGASRASVCVCSGRSRATRSRRLSRARPRARALQAGRA